MKAEIKGDNLVITIPINKEGTLSTSKKSLIHATSGGNKETDIAMPNGKKLIVGVNAYSSVK